MPNVADIAVERLPQVKNGFRISTTSDEPADIMRLRQVLAAMVDSGVLQTVTADGLPRRTEFQLVALPEGGQDVAEFRADPCAWIAALVGSAYERGH